MATVPIVTDVTKAQLDALVAVNGLNEGLQYNVTDKSWLLLATSNATLKSFTGRLIIEYTDYLPDYIDTEILIISALNITDDLSNETGVPLSLNVSAKYVISHLFIKNINIPAGINNPIFDRFGSSFILTVGDDINEGQEVKILFSKIDMIQLGNDLNAGTHLALTKNGSGAVSFNFYFELHTLL